MKLRFLFAGLMTSAVAIFGSPLATMAAPQPDVVEFKGGAQITSGDTCGAAVCYKGGTGSYQFNDNSCNAVSGDDVVPPGCNIGLSGGNFVNTACGTGTADSSGPTSLGENDGENYTISAYHIQFVAGLGVLTGSSDDGDFDAVVQISPSALTAPTAGAPGQGACTTGFNVTGVGATAS